MAKREIRTLDDVKKVWTMERSQATRKVKRERFMAILKKDRLETFEDAYDLVCGLSKKDAYRAASYYIMEDILNPQEIIALLLEHRR